MTAAPLRIVPWIFWVTRKVTVADLKPSVDRIRERIQAVIKAKMAAGESAKKDAKDVDLLDRMIAATNESSTLGKPVFSTKELQDETVGFFLAGHETTANTLTFIVLEISRPENKHIFTKIRQEIDSVMAKQDKLPESEKMTLEEIAKHLSYSGNVVKESQRMHAVVQGVSKAALSDTMLGEYVIPGISHGYSF